MTRREGGGGGTPYDAIVVGLGGMGSAAAHHLATRGVRVLGLEQFEPGHDRGSSHGDSRIIRQAYFEHPSYVPLVQRSYELFGSLGDQVGRPVLTRTGGVVIGEPRSDTVAGAVSSARQWGLEHEVLSATRMRERFPTLPLGDDEVAVFEPRAGYVEPERTVLAQVELARRAGADLRFGQRVERWEPAADGGRVTTTGGETFSADRLLFCAGAWAPKLLPGLGDRLRVERQVMHWFAPEYSEPFAATRHPVYIWQDPDGDVGYGFPARPGESTVKAAFFRRIDPVDPDRLRREVTAAEVAEMTRAMRRRVPDAGRHRAAVACMYTLSPDRHFVVGPHPEHPGVVVAAGFSGHGFKFVPLVGEVLADLAVDGGTRHDIGLFDPARLTRL